MAARFLLSTQPRSSNLIESSILLGLRDSAVPGEKCPVPRLPGSKLCVSCGIAAVAARLEAKLSPRKSKVGTSSGKSLRGVSAATPPGEDEEGVLWAALAPGWAVGAKQPGKDRTDSIHMGGGPLLRADPTDTIMGYSAFVSVVLYRVNIFRCQGCQVQVESLGFTPKKALGASSPRIFPFNCIFVPNNLKKATFSFNFSQRHFSQA